MEESAVNGSAPAHAPAGGARRRSSILAAQMLDAICETDDEIFEETLRFDFVALGGGVAAGYWARGIAASLAEHGHTAAIVSGDPEGFAPFERPALSKECLNPSSKGARDASNSAAFPFVCKGAGGEPQPPEWYAANGIDVLSGCQAVFADLDQKYLKVKRIKCKGNGKLVFGDTFKVVYGRLLIATGVRARRITDSVLDGMAKGLQGSCFCTRYPDLAGFPADGSFGFGSVHYLRDMGDTLKLVQAMSRVEADGQDTCKEPAVLIGGGFISCEVAAAIATHCPGMPLTMVMPGENIMGSAGFSKEICHFYEKQLARVGVVFAKGYRVVRLWGVDEDGSFPTLERSAQGSNLKKTHPRTFGPADPHFTESRGVVLVNKDSGEKVWLSARFIVVGIGSVPNSELFKDSLVLAADGGIVTDSSLRASHPSGDVFAAGDVACAPVPHGGYDEGSGTAAGMRFEHVQTARDMGMHVAGAMLERAGSDRSYDSVPHMYSRFLDVSWKFYGVVKGESCVLGMDAFPITRTFGAFWVNDGRIVGAFLKEDTASGVDHSATLERMAREQPPVLSTNRLRKCPLDDLLADPYCLAPPKLGVGEFHADTDEASIEEAFRKHAWASSKVKRADMGAVMKDLGADWDTDELTDALEALDPSDSGSVHLPDFVAWWSN